MTDTDYADANHPCGPASWKTTKIPRWIRAHAPNFVWKSACVQHDVDYKIGGTEANRKRADQEFYFTMKHHIARRKGVINRAWLKLFAWLYYRAVRTLGQYAFRYDVRPDPVFSNADFVVLVIALVTLIGCAIHLCLDNGTP